MAYNRAIAGDNTSSRSRSSGATEELFGLLDEFCSNSQLRFLLKLYRPTDRDFRLGGNREELLVLVRRLFDSGQLSREKIEELLDRAEENGRQHIFLYVPTSRAVQAKLNDFDLVQSGLLDGRTRESAGLPKFQLHPNGIEEADLRYERRAGTKYATWTYKLYAGAERWEQTGQPDIHGDEKTVHYRRRYRREVVLVKWHSFGLLELRVPVGRNRNQVQSVRDKLLGTLINKLDLENTGAGRDSTGYSIRSMAEEFLPVVSRRAGETQSHPPGMQALVPLTIPTSVLDQQARSKGEVWISVNAGDFDVDGHTLSIDTDDDQEDIYDSKAVVAVLKPMRDCKRLRVLIHLREQPEFPEKLSVEFSPSFRNEIRISARTTPEAVEFVVRRVWEHAGKGELPPSPVDILASEGTSDVPLADLDFDAFARRYPSLANAIRRIQRWVIEHPTAGFLDPARLQRTVGSGIPAPDMAAAVARLVEDGVLARKYLVRPPNRRGFTPKLFDSADDLLGAKITDDKGETVDLDNVEVVPVYGKAER